MKETVRTEFKDIMEHFFNMEIVINDKRGDTKAEMPLAVFTFIAAVIIMISLRLFLIACAVFTMFEAHCFLRKHTGEMIDVSPAEVVRIAAQAFVK